MNIYVPIDRSRRVSTKYFVLDFIWAYYLLWGLLMVVAMSSINI